MPTATHKGLACPACSSGEFDPLENISVAEQHRRFVPDDRVLQDEMTAVAAVSASGYAMRRCLRCGLEYCDPMVAPSADWYALAYHALDLYPARRWEFEYVLERLRANDRVYEFGSGDGAFLKLCGARGIAAAGGDFSADAVAACRRAQLEAEVLDLRLRAQPRVAPADHVVAFHVLEHLDQPATLFEFANRVAAPTATLWIAVPSHRRPTRMLHEVDFLDQPPHHMTRWTDLALRALGERCGWDLREVVFEPIATRSSVWWIASRSPLARRFHGGIGRAMVWAQYPGGWIMAKTRFREMTGFTMLARFENLVGGRR